MSKHVLSLEVPDTMNPCQIMVIDTSIYNEDTPAKCQVLEITYPGFNQSVQFGEDQLPLGFSENFTACDLELQIDGCGTNFNDLSDGIYILKWSVSPNDQVYVEYNHLRITNALIMYQAALCGLDELGACSPDAELSKKMKELTQIRLYLDAAKAKVEYCHEPLKGMELYNYALKLLGKFECKSCMK
jgi:hypothetical protein